MASPVDSVPTVPALPATQRLRRFLRWWLGELAMLVPIRLRPAGRLLKTSLFIQADDDQLTAWHYLHGHRVSLGVLDLSNRNSTERPMALRNWLAHVLPGMDAAVLVLCPERALYKTIALPAAADENLHQVIAYELDRYTPFKAEEVYFDFRVLRRGLGNEDLQVGIGVAPRSRIDALIGLLTQAGLRPVAVVLERDLSPERMPLNLLPTERRQQQGLRLGPLNAALAALAVLMFALALGLPIWQKRQTIEALTPQVQRARQAAEAASELQAQLDRRVREYNVLLERKHAYPAAVIVLEELARILPDHTWLIQVDLRSIPAGWEVVMLGETTASSRLASLVEASPLFQEAGFKSPLIKGQTPASERFQLGALLESRKPPARIALADKHPPLPREVPAEVADQAAAAGPSGGNSAAAPIALKPAPVHGRP